MEKSLASKKEIVNNKNNNATGGNPNNPKSIPLKDPRPLRDSNFMKMAKQKLLKFLETTEYPRKFEACIFTKLTQSDVKALFEHFITLVDPDFRLNDSQISSEERILNFFNTIQYKNSFSKTHITSPTIVSSVPFVIGALDFLRRFITAFLITNPSMLFPRLTDHSISSEIILGPLISIHKTLENENSLPQDLTELQDTILKEIGAKSNEEIALMTEKVDSIEELLKTIEKTKLDSESFADQIKDLDDSIEIEDVKYENEKKLNEALQLELLEEEGILECVAKEKAYLDARRTEFEELGYGEKINQIEDYQDKVITIRSQHQHMKSEMEILKQTSKTILYDIEQIKLQSQKLFADIITIFPNLVDDEILQVVAVITAEHLLTYDRFLRPYISRLISAIEAEAQLKQEDLKAHLKICENLQKQLDVLNRDNEILEMENQQYLNNIKQNEIFEQEIKQKTIECFKTIQDLGNQINVENVANKDEEEGTIILKKKMEEAKIFNEEANQFYEVDIEFNKECAEIRLQSLQDEWETRQSIVKMNEIFLNQNREQIDLQRMEVENFALNLMNMFECELKDLN